MMQAKPKVRKRRKSQAIVPVPMSVKQLEQKIELIQGQAWSDIYRLERKIVDVENRLKDIQELLTRENMQQFLDAVMQLDTKFESLRMQANRAETSISKLSDVRNIDNGEYVKTTYFHSWLESIHKELQGKRDRRRAANCDG